MKLKISACFLPFPFISNIAPTSAPAHRVPARFVRLTTSSRYLLAALFRPQPTERQRLGAAGRASEPTRLRWCILRLQGLDCFAGLFDGQLVNLAAVGRGDPLA
jgi:hypothetical protein